MWQRDSSLLENVVHGRCVYLEVLHVVDVGFQYSEQVSLHVNVHRATVVPH